LAHEIWSRSGVSVVCTIVNVPDRMAFTTGRLLAEKLGEHGDLRQAYEESRPGANRVYVFLPGESLDYIENEEGDSRMRAAANQGGARSSNVRAGNDAMDTVDSLVRALQGDPFNRSIGLIEQMATTNRILQESAALDAEWKRATEDRLMRVEVEQERIRKRSEETAADVESLKRYHVSDGNVSSVLGSRWWVLLAFMVALVAGEFALIWVLLRFVEGLPR